jgi:predicted ATP-dependent serine protease
MICPQCGAKYPQEATRCPECGVELVDQAARAPQDMAEWVDDVVVLETTDEGQLMVARSLLEAEGIPCFAQGEEGQQLIGAGPVRLRVRVGDREAARALLAHLEPTGPSEE